ncbi:MAG: GNAT family N-acetyltransferase [Candidatus Promineifilaceae bacterium]|nr:GNAT family N-acetyltransferase [Candidatus Promineifilaceae bacterium]
MSLEAVRNAIRPLLNPNDPQDAMAVYYAFYHPIQKTELIIHPKKAKRAEGYVSVSRTGLDLFRPLITMRLPRNFEVGAELLYTALPEESAVMIYAPLTYRPLLDAVFDIQTDETYRLLVIDRSRFKPIINVHVTQASGPNNLPRFIIRATHDRDQVAAASGLNWQTPNFSEISVNTTPGQRRQGWGRSVVAAMVQYVLESGRTPLYVVTDQNEPSLRLAESVGFVDTGKRLIFAQAIRRKAN